MNGAIVAQGIFFRWVRSEDWTTFLLASAGLLVVVRSVEVAEWVATPSLVLMAALGALVGLLATRIPWRAWQGHISSVVLGAIVVYLLGTGLAEAETTVARMAELNSRLAAFWSALLHSGISTDPLPFALLLSALAWMGGYVSSWAVFKLGNVWLAILPGAIGLFINLTYLPERYYVYLFPYLLAAMLLVTRLTVLQRQALLERQGIAYPASLRILWMSAALVFSSFVIGVVFLLPARSVGNDGLRQIWNVSRQPAEWFQQEFGRLFSSVSGRKSMSSQRFGAVLPLLGSAPAGDTPVFFGRIDFEAYWRARTYANYTPGGWTVDDTIERPLVVPTEEEIEYSLGIDSYSYQVRMAAETSYLYVPTSQPYSLDIPVQIDTHDTNPPLADVVALRPEGRLSPNQEYEGTFLTSGYSEANLRGAGESYPDWVGERYLGLPSSFPGRVKDLAVVLTANADNPYDKARAIEEYLRTLDFGASPSTPGFGGDSVDHFLFGSETGYSDHFASAMAAMLRSIGIPARLVAGYGPGVPDPDKRVFVIRDKDYHSWVEVFFPGAEWIEFEPSPIYPLRPLGQGELIGFDTAVAQAVLGGLFPTEFDLLEDNDYTLYEDDCCGGRLPGGFGPRPFPLMYSPSPMGMGGAILVVFVALWAGALWLGWRRFFVKLPRPEQAYSRLSRMAGFLGVSREPGQTALEFGRALATTIPPAEDDITLICETFSRTRYGRAKLSVREGSQIRRAWDSVRKTAIRHGAG